MISPSLIGLSPDEILEYLRKSRTDDPLLDVTEVLERHETMLDEWAEKNLGGKVPEENKFREVVSGETIDSRPRLLDLLKKIESPKIKAILIVEVQRLGRPDLEDIGRLSKLFRYTNTLIITPTKTFDLRNEYDREAFERELMRGNEYLEYTKKIMNRGRLLSVQQGNFIGNKAPYGYRKITVTEGKKKCHTLEIVPEEAEVVRMIFDMYINQDMRPATIAHKLNEMGVPTSTGSLWGQDTLRTMLTNDHYIGKVRWNWRKTLTIVEDGEIKKIRPKTDFDEYLVYDGKHPAIIDEATFYAVREKKGKVSKAPKKTKVRNMFSGLLFCQCGRSMSLRHANSVKAAPRLSCEKQYYCKTTSCLYSEMIDEIRGALQRGVDDLELRIKNDDVDSRRLHETQIRRLKLKLEELERKELSQWEKYSEEKMPKEIFDKLNAKVLKEKDEIQQALCVAYESLPDIIDYQEQLDNFKAALAGIDDPNLTPEKKNKLLKACIVRITYNRDKAERIKSQQVRRTVNGVRKATSPLRTGGNWTRPEIQLRIQLTTEKDEFQLTD